MQSQNGFFIQFLRLAGPFWNSENKAVIRNQTLALIVLTVLQMALAVIITEWSAALFNALEQHSMSGLWAQIGYLVLIFVASMVVTALHMKVKRQLQIGWRSWLTERVIGQWMNKGRHYQVLHIQTVEHDNPDGRIAEDIRIATDEAISLCHTLFYSLLLIISFTQILWELSGTVILDLGLFKLPVYGYLVWVAVIYSAGGSVLGWWASQPLTLTTNAMQTAEANFRFGLAKARENSQAIALIHGEINEKKRFHDFFQNIITVYDRQTQAWVRFEGHPRVTCSLRITAPGSRSSDAKKRHFFQSVEFRIKAIPPKRRGSHSDPFGLPAKPLAAWRSAGPPPGHHTTNRRAEP